MTVHVPFPLPRPRQRLAHRPSGAGTHDAVLALTAPALTRGDDLAPFALQVRRAIQQGAAELQVDETACSTWSPGQLLVLEHLRRLAQRCGTRWTAVEAVAAAGAGGCSL